MRVYGIYVPTARTPSSGLEMESFPSREVAGRHLIERCHQGAGRTWYLRDGNRRECWPRPVRLWEDADETGYYRIFLRYAADPVPGLLETPDEEWLVNPGGKRGVLVRLPWEDSDGEVLRLTKQGVRVLPSVGDGASLPVRPAGRPAARRPRPTRAKATPAPLVAPPRAVCGRCFQERDSIAGCGCPDSGAELVMEMQRPTRYGWEKCQGCGKAVTAYARCGCS